MLKRKTQIRSNSESGTGASIVYSPRGGFLSVEDVQREAEPLRSKQREIP